MSRFFGNWRGWAKWHSNLAKDLAGGGMGMDTTISFAGAGPGYFRYHYPHFGCKPCVYVDKYSYAIVERGLRGAVSVPTNDWPRSILIDDYSLAKEQLINFDALYCGTVRVANCATVWAACFWASCSFCRATANVALPTLLNMRLQ